MFSQIVLFGFRGHHVRFLNLGRRAQLEVAS